MLLGPYWSGKIAQEMQHWKMQSVGRKVGPWGTCALLVQVHGAALL
jgi:hypothetical protein